MKNTPNIIPLDYIQILEEVELDAHGEMMAIRELCKFKLLISPRAVEILDTLVKQKKIEEAYRDRIVHALHYYSDHTGFRFGFCIPRREMEAVFGPNYNEIYPYFFQSPSKDVCPFYVGEGDLYCKIREEFVNHKQEYPITRFGIELQRLVHEDMRVAQHIKKKERIEELAEKREKNRKKRMRRMRSR